jgi:16S rRNA (guanine(966)-N(2))-methyltransferase RsmD
VREALFSILGARCLGARVADVCAGTGALGLEALSRGAGEVTFIERNRKVSAILRQNIERIGLEGAIVIEDDVLTTLGRLACQERAFDIVLVDPPYEAGLFQPIAQKLIDGQLLAPEGLVVIEHPAERALELVGLNLTDRRRYGGVALSFFESG